MPGTRSKFGAPIFESEVFRRQMYCIEEFTCDIVGTFRRPRSQSAPPQYFSPPEWFGARVITPPLPLVTPLLTEP